MNFKKWRWRFGQRVFSGDSLVEYSARWTREFSPPRSNIGNFDKSHESTPSSNVDRLNPDDLLLVGFDLKKDIDLLLHAYNDSKSDRAV